MINFICTFCSSYFMTMLPCSKLIKANTIQTQVSDLGARALAISLPFACVLGLLSSMIASTMGKIFSSNLLSSLYIRLIM